ncbi:hypothetical protein P3S67_012257 [Capsicum chacoense]|uniref:uncharacterized protein LOC124890808 n=1 Tax=Capsicum annuum TaxID=4072 RepID=UPI001FB17583|nr:uncharacterized protein LOC124890808 [Capsicum annuum]
MNMDEILKNIYSDSNPFASDPTVTFTVTTFVAINSIVVVAGGGGGGDVVLSKTVDEALEIQGKHSEAVVKLFKICVIHQIFPPKEFSFCISSFYTLLSSSDLCSICVSHGVFCFNSFGNILALSH